MTEFTYKEKYGIFSDKHKLVPAPNFMMRRRAILDAIRELKPGRLIEMGSGMGVCTYELYRKGFDCTGYDIEPKVVDMANAIFNSDGKMVIDFRSELYDSDKAAYDYLAAFEVLEHIKDDYSLVDSWSVLLKNEGRIIFSVPAKMKYFSYGDKVVGHLRRYEKKELINLLKTNLFEVELLISYGFPFSNLTTRIVNLTYRRRQFQRLKNMTNSERSQASGYMRIDDYGYKKFIPYAMIYLFTKIQKLFYNKDLGLGYVVVARKMQKQ